MAMPTGTEFQGDRDVKLERRTPYSELAHVVQAPAHQTAAARHSAGVTASSCNRCDGETCNR